MANDVTATMSSDSWDSWRNIIDSVPKHQIPINVTDVIMVKLIDGHTVDVNISDMFNTGLTANEIEQKVEQQLSNLDSYIEEINFKINIAAVISEIQPMVDELLT